MLVVTVIVSEMRIVYPYEIRTVLTIFVVGDVFLASACSAVLVMDLCTWGLQYITIDLVHAKSPLFEAIDVSRLMALFVS